MGKDIIVDPDFDLCSDEDVIEHDDIPEECFEEDTFEEFLCELEAFLDIEIDETQAVWIKQAVEFYFGDVEE